MNTILERLHSINPLPAETLSVEQAANVLGIATGSFRNILSQGRMPFQVQRVGGSVRISKEVLARFLNGETATKTKQDDDKKPKARRGRPLNSIGLQRYAAFLLLDAIERVDRIQRANLESVFGGKTFPKRKWRSL